MSEDNISKSTPVPLGEEMDTKTVEFLLSDNQSYLIVLLILMGTVIIIANRWTTAVFNQQYQDGYSPTRWQKSFRIYPSLQCIMSCEDSG